MPRNVPLINALAIVTTVLLGVLVARIPLAAQLGVATAMIASVVVGVVALRAHGHAGRVAALAETGSWSRLLAYLPAALVFVIALDVNALLLRSGVERYAFLAPLAAAALVLRIGRPTTSAAAVTVADRIVLVLSTAVVVGSIAGQLLGDTATTFLPLGVAMVVGATATRMGGTASSARILTVVTIGLAVYCLMHAAAVRGIVSPDYASPFSKGTYTFEKAPLFAMGVVATARRHRALLPVFVAALIVAYLDYPAATYLVVAATTLVVLAVGRGRRVKLRAAAVALGLLAVVGTFSADVGQRDSLLRDYFRAAGKEDNTRTRLLLWTYSLDVVDDRPVAGTFFAGEATVAPHVASLPDRVPPHNDLLQLALGGGALAVLLFLVWVSIVCWRYVVWMTARGPDHARDDIVLMRVLMVGFAGLFGTLLFNPILLKPPMCALFFSMGALILSLSARADDEEPA